MPIKVAALDVYGTIIPSDFDCNSPSRLFFDIFFDNCDKRGIKVVTSSDGQTGSVKNHLTLAFTSYNKKHNCKNKLSVERFDDFFQLDQGLKDFSIIIGHYDIIPKELLVIGNDPNEDIYAALKLGANAILCPTYWTDEGEEWDFSKINLDDI